MKIIYFLIIMFNDVKLALIILTRFLIKGQVSDFYATPKFLNRKLEIQFFWVYLIDSFFIKTQHKRNLKLKKRLKQKFKDNLISCSKLPEKQAIPTFHSKDITEDLIKELLQKKHPFIIKEYFKDSFAVNHWNLEYFIERYGECEVLAGDPDKNIDTLQKLKNVRKDNVYVRNVEALFLKDKQLAQQIELERLQQHGFDKDSWLQCVQLFIASSQKARSAYHNAKSDNFFVMIHGKKKWWFINPVYTHGMEPYFNKRMGYYESRVGHPLEPNPECTIYPYLPVMESEIEPGDLLFSPSLWWHAVQNTTVENIASSTRWFSGNMETYYPLSLLQIVNPGFMPIKLRFVEEIREHLKQFGKMVNFHKDRHYASLFDVKKQKTLFEEASHQVDYQTSLENK